MSLSHARLGRDQGLLRREILVHRARFRCEKCGHRVTGSRVSKIGVRRCELHHIKPLSKGGRHTPENVELLCRECHFAHHRAERIRELPTPRREWAELLQSY